MSGRIRLTVPFENFVSERACKFSSDKLQTILRCLSNLPFLSYPKGRDQDNFRPLEDYANLVLESVITQVAFIRLYDCFENLYKTNWPSKCYKGSAKSLCFLTDGKEAIRITAVWGCTTYEFLRLAQC